MLSLLLRHINFVERLWEKVIHSSILYAIARDFSPHPPEKALALPAEKQWRVGPCSLYE
jgi:hypothetical protein